MLADDLFSLAALMRTPGYAYELITVMPQVGEAQNAGIAVDCFRRAVHSLGADAGVFQSVVIDSAECHSVRYLLATDPVWTIQYEQLCRERPGPWIRHAMHSEMAIRGTELSLLPEEEDFVRTAARLGFASSLAIPIPSCVGISRVGVLLLGSCTLGFFESEGFPTIRAMARSLAGELNQWLLASMRAKMIARFRLTAQDIALLRHEAAGHTSKTISAELDIEPKAVDSRFHRLAVKLNVPDRRTAARIARLYGVL